MMGVSAFERSLTVRLCSMVQTKCDDECCAFADGGFHLAFAFPSSHLASTARRTSPQICAEVFLYCLPSE